MQYKTIQTYINPLSTWALQALLNNWLHQALSPTNLLETPSLNRQSKATKLVSFGFQPPIVSIPLYTSKHWIFGEGEEGYKFLQVYAIWERNREEKMCRNFGLRLRFSLSQQEEEMGWIWWTKLFQLLRMTSECFPTSLACGMCVLGLYVIVGKTRT